MIVPLLTAADGSVIFGMLGGDTLERFAEVHADALVRLFWAILTKDALDWSYAARAFVAALEKGRGCSEQHTAC